MYQHVIALRNVRRCTRKFESNVQLLFEITMIFIAISSCCMFFNLRTNDSQKATNVINEVVKLHQATGYIETTIIVWYASQISQYEWSTICCEFKTTLCIARMCAKKEW